MHLFSPAKLSEQAKSFRKRIFSIFVRTVNLVSDQRDLVIENFPNQMLQIERYRRIECFK